MKNRIFITAVLVGVLLIGRDIAFGAGWITQYLLTGVGPAVMNAGGQAASWGSITGSLSSQTDLQTALDGKLATAGDGSALTALNATQLTSGTMPDGRFPATLPAASGVNLTALNATQLTSGTVPDARFPATLPATSGVNLTALNATNLASGTVAVARLPVGTRTQVTLGSDQTDSSGANTYADCTGLSFAVTSGIRYHFRAQIWYTAPATTTGSGWSINGPAATNMAYRSQYTLAATTITTNHATAYNIPAASNATSIVAGNIAIIEGTVLPSANGSIVVRFMTEVDTSAIVCKAGSTLEWWVS